MCRCVRAWYVVRGWYNYRQYRCISYVCSYIMLICVHVCGACTNVKFVLSNLTIRMLNAAGIIILKIGSLHLAYHMDICIFVYRALIIFHMFLACTRIKYSAFVPIVLPTRRQQAPYRIIHLFLRHSYVQTATLIILSHVSWNSTGKIGRIRRHRVETHRHFNIRFFGQMPPDASDFPGGIPAVE